MRSVIDTATGVDGSSALADEETADEVRDELPDHRVAEAYVSADGATDLLRGSTGIRGSLEPFVSPRTTRGAAAALAAGDGELEIAVRSLLDPDRARARPGFFAAFAPFEAELPERLASDSLAYLGLGDPERTVQALLKQASTERPGIATGFDDLARELRRDGEIDLEQELLPALGEEAAFAIAPRPEAETAPEEGQATIPPPPGEGPAAEPAANESTPYLEFVARDVDEARARRALAQLQGPVAAGIEPQAGPPARRVRGARDRRGPSAQPPGLARRRAHLRGFRRACRRRHQPERDRAARRRRWRPGRCRPLRAGNRGLRRRALAARLLRPRGADPGR